VCNTRNIDKRQKLVYVSYNECKKSWFVKVIMVYVYEKWKKNLENTINDFGGAFFSRKGRGVHGI
jgi:hypothetical protein